MLERFTNQEELNIKDLTVDHEVSAETPAPFDPERYISPENWQPIEATFSTNLGNLGSHPGVNLDEILSMAVGMKDLGHQPDFSGEEWDRILKRYDLHNTAKSSYIPVELAGFIRELGGNVPIDNECISIAYEHLNETREYGHTSGNHYQDFANAAADLKLIGEEPEINEDDWIGIKNTLKRMLNEEKWIQALALANSMKILGREPELSKEFWEGCLNELDRYKQKEINGHGHYWQPFAVQAAWLKNLLPNPDNTQPDDVTRELPEERSF